MASHHRPSVGSSSTDIWDNQTLIECPLLPSPVQLWCVGNYHWYLKQELHLTPPPGHTHQVALTGLLWDPIVPLRLHLLTQGQWQCLGTWSSSKEEILHDLISSAGQYMCYNWRWGVAESKTHSQDNMASLAVIDGCKSFSLSCNQPQD